MPFKIFVFLSLQLHIIKKIVNAENDFQQTNLAEPVDCDDNGLMQLPKSIKLQTSSAVLSRRTSRKVVLRYDKPNRNIHPEKYLHSLLIFFYPFTNENDLMLGGSYAAKLSEENVLEFVNQNKQKFEPNGNLSVSYVHQLHQQERHMFLDYHSSDNIDFDVETDNVQINNNLDCNSIPRQIASEQVDDNDF